MRCDFSGNFLISGNFGNSALCKRIGKHFFSGNFKAFHEILIILNHISALCNCNNYITLVMISSLYFDKIIMMSRFVELCDDIIESSEIPALTFSAAILMHVKMHTDQQTNYRQMSCMFLKRLLRKVSFSFLSFLYF